MLSLRHFSPHPQAFVHLRLALSGVTMGWLLRLVTGGPQWQGGPVGAPAVQEFLMINF